MHISMYAHTLPADVWWGDTLTLAYTLLPLRPFPNRKESSGETEFEPKKVLYDFLFCFVIFF